MPATPLMTDFEIYYQAPEGASEEELLRYLDEACSGDAELRARVEALFALERRSRDFLEDNPVESSGLLVDEEAAIGEGPGAVIGNYRLVEKIGEGGFGVVYRAEQSAPVRREVALKIVKPGMDTRQVLARFEAEKQALAMMDHSHIAKVHDAGSTEMGRPYFVMELVDGIPITKFCDRERLETRERLALFMEVCGAVQHAHQKGIIHRDLKPSNVLVTRHNGGPVPKVIDFGVAKATRQELADATIHTRQEHFIGTPAYMSPEQVEGGGQDLDTRSDIYALGVLLYELLTGTTPFDSKRLATASQEEVRRVIREEEPLRPSTRVSGLGAEERRELAERHKADPAALPRLLRGDLDWIVLKAMEKDRERRYETANGLAADLARHLADEPVTAGAPGAGYRIRKYVRRHRAGLSVAAALALLLVAGSVISGWMAVRANRERAKAEWNERVLAFDDRSEQGPVKLARLVARNREDRVAAGCMLTSIWQRDQIAPLGPSLEGGFSEQQVAVTRDGKWIATGYDKGTIQILSAETGEAAAREVSFLQPASAKAEGVHYLEFSADPKQRWLLASGGTQWGWPGLVELWEWKDENGEPLEELKRVATFPHKDYVIFAHLSPDRKWVLTGGAPADGQRQPHLWNVETGTSIPVGDAAHHADLCGDWSNDGGRFATSGSSGSGTWQVGALDGKGGVSETVVTNRGQSHRGGIISIRFDPSGSRVVTASADGTAQVWSAVTGEAIGLRLHHDAPVAAAEFSPAGNLVVTASSDGTARLWDAETGNPVFDAFKHPGRVETAHFSPDGLLVMTDCEDGQVRIWSVATGELLDERMGRGWGRFTGDSRRVLLRGGPEADGQLRMWPILSSRSLHQQFTHRSINLFNVPGRVFAAAISPDGRRLVSVAREKMARLWDLESGRPLAEFDVLTEAGKDAVFSPDGEWILLPTTDEGLRIASSSAPDGTIPPVYGKRNKMVIHAEFSPVAGGPLLVVATALTDNCAEVWEVKAEPDDEPKVRLELDAWCTGASFSGDGKRIVTMDIDGTVKVWEGDWGNGEATLVATLEPREGQQRGRNRALFHPTDSNLLLTSSWREEDARIWDIGRGFVLHTLSHEGVIYHSVWSPDGAMVLTASDDRTAVVWDARTGRRVGQPLRHERQVTYAEFDPAGKRVVTASSEGAARVWDVASGFPLSPPLRHDAPVTFGRFSVSGTQVVTGGDDATVRLWEVPPVPEGAVPAWVPGWVEAVSGLKLDESGHLVGVNAGVHEAMKAMVEALPLDGYYARIAKWYYQDPETRPITPFSKMSRQHYLENRLQEKSVEGFEEVLRLDHGNLEALAGLVWLCGKQAQEGGDPAKQALAIHYAKLALQAGADDGLLRELVSEDSRRRAQAAALERIRMLGEQARGFLEAGQVVEGRSLLVPAAVGFILVAAEFEGNPLPQLPVTVDRALRAWAELRRPPMTLVPAGAEWRVAPPGARFSSDWARSEFIDPTWTGGPAPIGFSANREDVEETRIEPDDTLTTYYFRHAFQVGESDLQAIGGSRLALRIRCDDGAVVYLNGKEVLRVNMPAGVIGPDTPAAATRSGQAEQRWFEFQVDANSLTAGENLLAVEVHQKHGAKQPSSDLMLDLDLKLLPSIGELLWSHVGDDRAAIVSALGFAVPEFLTPERRQHWIAALAQHASPGATVEDLEFRVRVQVALEQWDAAVEGLDLLLSRQDHSFDPAEVRRGRELLRQKAELLEMVGRSDEAKAVRNEVTAIPPRDLQRDPRQIDLTEHYTESLFSDKTPADDTQAFWMERLPELFDPGDGPRFDIRGRIDLGGEGSSERKGRPLAMKVENIAVDQPAARIHFLHACGNVSPDGLEGEVARYVVHYADGTSDPIPVIYGKDMVRFWIHPLSEEERAAIDHIAWEHSFTPWVGNPSNKGVMALTRQTWENPHSDKVITHIDFESAGKAAAPFLVAITVE